jgi:hypothetical protein
MSLPTSLPASVQARYTSDGRLELHAGAVVLRGGVPVVNGQVLDGWSAAVTRDDGVALQLRFHAPEGGAPVFGVTVEREGPAGGCRLRWWLDDLPAGTPLDRFGLRFAAVENLRQYLRMGYTSWDGSAYVEPEGLADFGPDEERPETGYALTQLLPRGAAGSVVLGFERHDRFQHTFVFDTRAAAPVLTVLTEWDRRARPDGGRVSSEALLVFAHPDVEEALREWARQVAAALPRPPRAAGERIVGWCSWYNLYAYVNEDNVLAHLHAAARARERGLPLRVFQIDDGFTPEMGDWLELKPQFPRGVRPLLDDIRAAGFTPGLWIAPFMVGNRSRLYQEHPDWVVRDRASGGPLVQWQLYGETRWHKRSEEYYVLDTTHPQAFEYLRHVFHVWRQAWGCEYFKTDFMHYGSDHGPARAVWHTPGMTRIEIWRRVAEMIREELGEATWLGCGCPLWPAAGLVDGIRVSSDVGVTWQGSLAAESLLRDLPLRSFANRILWQADPDCVLLRERFHHLSDAEVRSLAIFAGMAGGVLTTSDDFDELGPARLQLWQLIAGEPGRCDFPLLGQTAIVYDRVPEAGGWRVRHAARPADPVLVQVRRGTGGAAAVFAFNIGERAVQRHDALAALGIAGPRYVYDWTAGEAWPEPAETLTYALPAHGGTLLFLGAQPFKAPPATLP